MLSINPYLNFPGNTEEAFNFYKSVFGRDFTALQRFKDIPDGDKVPAENAEKIMHIALPLPGCILMATDSVEGMGQKLIPGNNFSLTINAESREEADKIFHDLSEGGKIDMPLADAFWGAYFGMLTDKFGMQWMVSYAN